MRLLDAYAETGLDGTTFLWVLDPMQSAFGRTPDEARAKLEARVAARVRVVEEVSGNFQLADATAFFGPELTPATRDDIARGLTTLEARRSGLVDPVAALDAPTLDAEQLATLRAVDGERWTVRKLMRRVVWHQDVHARSVARIGRELAGRGPVGAAPVEGLSA